MTEQIKTLDEVRQGATVDWALVLLEKRRVELVRHHERFPYTADKSMAETAIAIELVSQALSAAQPLDGWVTVPVEPTPKMLKAAWAAMCQTPGRTWKNMKAARLSEREIFDAKMKPRYAAMVSMFALSSAPEGGS